MNHRRSLFAGCTDYTAVSVADIVGDLRKWQATTDHTIARLTELRESVVDVSTRLERPTEKLQYLDYFLEVLSRFSKEFDRLAAEISSRPTRAHVEAVRALYDLAVRSENVCADFKHDHIQTKIAEDQLRYSLVDPIYGETRGQIIDFRDLSNLASRLEALADSMPNMNTGRSDHPGWRLAVVVVVLGLAIFGFWVLPFWGAALLLIAMIVVLPIAIAGVSHRGMEGSDYGKMYKEGLRALPLVGEIIKKFQGGK